MAPKKKLMLILKQPTLYFFGATPGFSLSSDSVIVIYHQQSTTRAVKMRNDTAARQRVDLVEWGTKMAALRVLHMKLELPWS